MKPLGFRPHFHKCPQCKQSSLRWAMTKFAAFMPQRVNCTACGWSGTKAEVSAGRAA